MMGASEPPTIIMLALTLTLDVRPEADHKAAQADEDNGRLRAAHNHYVGPKPNP